MRSTLYDTLCELQQFRQSKPLEQIEISSPNKTPCTTKRKNDEPLVTSASKRPRRSCSTNKLYTEDNTKVTISFNDEKKSGDSDTVDLSGSPIPPTKSQHQVQAPPFAPVPAVRLKPKNFALTGKKRKEIIALCKSEGIDATGSDAVLKDRIKRFADYWKSECDREVHKSAATVVKEFRSMELKRAVSIHSIPSNGLLRILIWVKSFDSFIAISLIITARGINYE